MEYGNAITLLDQFVRKADVDELAIADEIVSNYDEYQVETNLSRFVRTGTRVGPGIQSIPPNDSSDQFRQHGLAWMTALARVELGAMLAGFTSIEKPFHAVPPTAHDRQAYGELLVDGYRTHFQAFQSDPAVKAFRTRGMPFSKVVSYGRRTQMIHAFREAAASMFASTLTPLQKSELLSQKGEIRRAELAFLYCLAKRNSNNAQERWTISESLRGCPPLLAAATRELNRPQTLSNTTGRTLQKPDPVQLLLLIDPTLAAIPCQ